MKHKTIFLILVSGFFGQNFLRAANQMPPVKTAEPFTVDFLSDETPASCGCFAWMAPEILTTGRLIYQEIDTTKKRYLNMKVAGKEISLKRKEEPKSPKKFASQKGIQYVEKLISPMVKVEATWTATQIVPSDEESASSANFDVVFKIETKKKSRFIKAAGYCGC